MTTLKDLGERRIVEELISKYVTGLGDDCAMQIIGDLPMVFTTDPVPPPAAAVIAGDDDPYWMGWLLVTINASDIAASGAKPVAFLASLDCPSDYQVNNFERLLSGIKDSCSAHELNYIGGNIREAPKLSAYGFAIGVSDGFAPLTREGGTPGDLIISIGQGGEFWRDVSKIKQGYNIEKKQSRLFAPIAQNKTVRKLGSLNLISATMDTSDGLYPTLLELAGKNRVGIEIQKSALTVPQSEGLDFLEEYQMWLGWGDWTVVAIVPQNKAEEIINTINDQNLEVCIIGKLTDKEHKISILENNVTYQFPKLDSERFVKSSWLSAGIDGYIDALKNTQLV